jgi:hypothetical protein
MSAVGWDKAGGVYYGKPVFAKGVILQVSLATK